MMQPLFASSAYTVPFWLPTNRRPPATVGCDQADVASGNPNAHFNRSFGTVCSVSPACSAGWNRVFVVDGDHPLHDGASAGTASGGTLLQRPNAAPVTSPPSGRPDRYSATARRSAPVSLPPCGRMPPAVNAERMASGDRRRRTSGAGARVSGAPVWQVLHSRWKTAAPSGVCAARRELARRLAAMTPAPSRKVAVSVLGTRAPSGGSRSVDRVRPDPEPSARSLKPATAST